MGFFLGMSALALLVAVFFTRRVVGSDAGTAATQPIWRAAKMRAEFFLKRRHKTVAAVTTAVLALLLPTCGFAQTEHAGGEANLMLPDLKTQAVSFFGMSGHTLLMYGLLF